MRPFTKEEFKILCKIRDNIKQFFTMECTDKITVGCSGGADSLCLLLSLYFCKEVFNFNYTLDAVYINHGLRKEAVEEGKLVLTLCNLLNIPGKVIKIKINGKNIMEEARNKRYEALIDFAGKNGIIAVGHNMNDQAETILMRLLGLCSSTNIYGMQMYTIIYTTPVIRPLLNIERKDIEYFVRNFPYVKDPTNEDMHYTRSVIRHRLIPTLQGYNPDVVKAIYRALS